MKEKNTEEMLSKIKDNKDKNTSKKSKIVIIAIVLLIAIGTVTGVISHLLQKKPVVEKQQKTTEVAKDTQDNGKRTLISLPKWAKTIHLFLEDEDKKEMIKAQENNFIGETAKTLPSEKDGFTSDIDKKFDNTGSLNEFYTPLTRENFTEKASIAIYRIINPYFGRWDRLQMPSNSTTESLLNAMYEDLATPEYIQSLLTDENKKSVIFWDEKKNNYNGELPQPTVRGKEVQFVGVIKKGEFKFSKDKEIITAIIDVDYMRSETKVFKSRTLKLDFKPQDDKLILVRGEVVSEK